MGFFNFFMNKEKTFTDEDIEKEYEKVQRKIQSRNMPSLNRAIERLARKTCTPQTGDDVLELKDNFIHCYSFKARMNRYYYSLSYKSGRLATYPLWTQKWQNHEQRARFQAQRAWREIMSHTR